MTDMKTNTEAESDLDANIEAESNGPTAVGGATTAQPVPDATENASVNNDRCTIASTVVFA